MCARICLHVPSVGVLNGVKNDGQKSYYYLQEAQKSARLLLFLIGLRQAKVVDGGPCMYVELLLHA